MSGHAPDSDVRPYDEALANLRHVYSNLINGGVKDSSSAKRIAVGLLAPAIEALEHAALAQAAPKTALSYFADDVEAAMAQESGWRPIETAPKDRAVLLATEFDGPGDWRIKCGYYEKDIGGWRIWGASWKPTVWMELPTPPAPNQGEAS